MGSAAGVFTICLRNLFTQYICTLQGLNAASYGKFYRFIFFSVNDGNRALDALLQGVTLNVEFEQVETRRYPLVVLIAAVPSEALSACGHSLRTFGE